MYQTMYVVGHGAPVQNSHSKPIQNVGADVFVAGENVTDEYIIEVEGAPQMAAASHWELSKKTE